MLSKHNYIILLLCMAIFSCVEEIDLATETEFEKVLVVEATITNQVEFQRIKLSNTYRLENEGPAHESGATVKVIGDGLVFDFFETEPGLYISSQQFAAQPNVNYNLEIIANNGNVYESSTTQLTQQTQIDNLYLELGFNENEEEGISIFVDSFDPTGNSKFYRYTYEETYKIVAPFWNPEDLIVVEHEFPNCPVFAFQPKEQEELTCYNTVVSSEIILENTNVFDEDRVERFRVRFLNRLNYIITHRYSILLTQYTQSPEAHNYYKVLRELSSSESLLSQTQPGFLQGNLTSMSNANEKVVGFFEVSSKDSRRIFFNYDDLYAGEPKPPYIISCIPFSPPECVTGGGSPLASALSDSQGAKYFSDNDAPGEGEGGYFIVPGFCGDCTTLGSNQVPDFWEE